MKGIGFEPQRLRGDNFTPLVRTPWGGKRIASVYKAPRFEQDITVGESWEVSVEPSFPSVTEQGVALHEVVAADPVGWLGTEVARGSNGQLSLLVKLLDTADDLSVQVHPADGDPELADTDSGKPEAWIVLHAEPGAGLYLGFRDDVARSDVEVALRRGDSLKPLLNFVPVRRGEVFLIEAGTPHAIGRGLSLLEPQRVMPGRRAVTYRFWDWGRRYDEQGRRDDAGKPRQLHVERSLEVTRWQDPGGQAFVNACRSDRRTLHDGELRMDRVVDWSHFLVDELRGSGSHAWLAGPSLTAVTCVEGQTVIETELGPLTLSGGQSGVIPAAAGTLTVRADEALVYFMQPRP